MSNTINPTALVDGHVHLHGCFEPTAFLAAAHANFERRARLLGSTEWSGVLLFTESASADWFGRLADGETDVQSKGWRIQPLEEACSLLAEGPRGETLTLIAGRQIVAAERLEVLALGMRDKVADGGQLREVMRFVKRAGAICVLPWGNGKWLGSRGKVVRRLIDGAEHGEFFLGDNSGRLRWGPRPKEFDIGIQHGLYLLPGSDPLPFPSEFNKVGSYGFSLPALPDSERPFAWLRSRLEEQPQAIMPYGEREHVHRFITNQIAMQIYKRRA